ncbi:hypothetical protein AVEN_66886-1 [Araneus ventricosus]|uniref:Uncharacterized protein n=1 Tax=Araneus ventricosus TaxID=182803 RepID=A0A4Y2NH42_ARAVE|nr:hypothetical protein AVEN_66886-1 [Araneus ventricosus]
MQSLWLQKLDWNDSLPINILQVWNDILITLPAVNEINVPRYILSDDMNKIDLNGFSDASECAYGAVIYIRCVTNSGLIQTKLLCNKSRVASLKPVTVPRQNSYADRFNNYSSLVEYETSHRIELQKFKSSISTASGDMFHKIITLQMSFSEVQMPDIFEVTTFCGRDRSYCFVILPILKSILVLRIKQLKTTVTVSRAMTNDSDFLDKLLNLTNSYSKLIRILSFCCGFLKNSLLKNVEEGFLSAAELDNAEQLLIKKIQSTTFLKEIFALQDGKSVPVSSKLKSPDPFLDSNSILRDVGRLKMLI